MNAPKARLRLVHLHHEAIVPKYLVDIASLVWKPVKNASRAKAELLAKRCAQMLVGGVL